MGIGGRMRSRGVATPTVALALALMLVAVAGCGGGGGGGGSATSPTSQPTIRAAVFTFPASAVPPGFLPPGFNSGATVQVLDQSGTPITGASVVVDGVALGYVAASREYTNTLNIAPGALVTITVTVNGATYTASAKNYGTYPAITAPSAGSTWAPQVANLISWSGALPDASSQYAVGVFTPTGSGVWPGDNVLQEEPAGTTSTTVIANSLGPADYAVLVGIVEVLPLSGAAAGSGVTLGGFSYVPLTVSPPPATPVSLAVAPATVALGVGKSLQLGATANFTDGSNRDVTTQADWFSSDSAVVSTNTLGVLTGVGPGTATVTARYAGFSESSAVTVYRPNPSPIPPLSESVAYQIDYAHSGRATVGGSGPVFPPSAHWSVTLSGSVISYPLIAGGKVFVTTNAPPPGSSYGTTLYALDEATGATAWGPTPLPGTYGFSGIAYDHGTLFAVNFDGLLSTFDASTGAPGWSRQLPPMGWVTAPPTAVNGIVYVTGGNETMAIDESNGDTLSFGPGADHSSPAVSPDGVFISGPCEVAKFDPVSSQVLWNFFEACSGGGGNTVAYASNEVYARELFDASSGHDVNLELDAATGKQLGTFSATVIPAFSDTTGFFLNGSTLTATSSSTGATLWQFSGDGQLASAPIVIDDIVIIGSGSGTVYALDAASGNVVWTGAAGAPISGPDEQNADPLTGLGAGDGYLVVPAGNVLNGWRIVP